MKRKILVLGILLFMACANSMAQESLSVYRELSGEHSAQSVANLKTLRDQAKSEGKILVWISFGIHFTANPALRTPEIAAREKAEKEQHFSSAVAPIVAKGYATVTELPAAGAEAPGYLLAVDHQGLNELAKSSEVKHIGQIAQ